MEGPLAGPVRRRRVLLSACLSLGIAPLGVTAQIGMADSLKSLLSSTTDNARRAELMIKIGDEVFYLGTDSAVHWYDQAERCANIAGSRSWLAKVILRRGELHSTQNKLDSALILMDSAVAIAHAINDPMLFGEFYHYRGDLHKRMGNYDKALRDTYEGLALAKQAGDDMGIMLLVHDLALMLKIEGRNEEAERMMHEALGLAEKMRDYQWILDVEGHLGDDAKDADDPTNAQAHYARAFEFARQRRDSMNMSWNLERLGLSLAEQGRTAEARKRYLEALDLVKGMDPRFSVMTHDDMGALLLQSGDPRGSLEHLLFADATFRLGPAADEFADHLERLARTYAALGRWDLAYSNAERSRAMKDSLQSARRVQDLTQLRMQTEFQRTLDEEQARQRLRDELGAATLAKQRLVRNISIVGALLIALSLVLVERQRRLAKAARKRAEHSEKSKQQFLANMSHEIRTPMNAIMGMSAILKRGAHSPEQDKYLNAISQSSENLLVILNDILDLSKLEAGKIDLEEVPFEIRRTIDSVRDIVRFKAEEKGIMLEVAVVDNVPATLLGDPTRLNQILLNLAGNAVKFTERGTVTINVRSSVDLPGRPGGVELTIDVIDTGIGIPADRLDKIFEEFTQAYGDTTRKYGGTGLGLTISKRLAEMHGGSITVVSAQGVGSTFTVTIPYVIAGSSSEKDPVRADDHRPRQIALRDLRILLAEDNDFNAVVAQDELADAIPGVHVDIAANGRIAVEMAAANHYDVILMDVQMPEMNGYDATRAIRALPGDKSHTPIIAMTANVMKEEVDRCTEAGMNGFIPKPFKREELEGTIREVLRARAVKCAI
ncbi:MAG: ATP-binding protein [Flavobacteriales bacterium]